jgi:hypothetical protein
MKGDCINNDNNNNNNKFLILETCPIVRKFSIINKTIEPNSVDYISQDR